MVEAIDHNNIDIFFDASNLSGEEALLQFEAKVEELLARNTDLSKQEIQELKALLNELKDHPELKGKGSEIFGVLDSKINSLEQNRMGKLKEGKEFDPQKEDNLLESMANISEREGTDMVEEKMDSGETVRGDLAKEIARDLAIDNVQKTTKENDGENDRGSNAAGGGGSRKASILNIGASLAEVTDDRFETALASADKIGEDATVGDTIKLNAEYQLASTMATVATEAVKAAGQAAKAGSRTT